MIQRYIILRLANRTRSVGSLGDETEVSIQPLIAALDNAMKQLKFP